MCDLGSQEGLLYFSPLMFQENLLIIRQMLASLEERRCHFRHSLFPNPEVLSAPSSITAIVEKHQSKKSDYNHDDKAISKHITRSALSTGGKQEYYYDKSR